MPYISINDLEVFYEDIGAGTPVLFLHSSFSRGIIAFSAQISMFQSDFRCLLPDLRGHGRTKCRTQGWTTPRLADDAIAFLDALKIARAHLFGYSLGGDAALYCAVKYPERFLSIVTIGTSGSVTDEVRTCAGHYDPDSPEQRLGQDFIELIKVNHYEAHGGNWRQFLKDSVDNWRKYPVISEEEFRKTAIPALFIAGKNDPFVTKDQLDWLVRNVKGAKGVFIEGCGHRPHMVGNKPEYVNRIVIDFFKEHSEVRH